MRKFILVTFLVVLFTGCTKYYEEYNINTYNQLFEVKSTNWKSATDPLGYLYFYYTFSEPALTNTVLNNGSLNTYLYYKEAGKDTFSPLPYSDFIVKDGIRWEEQLTVEYQPGLITFILKSDDHANAHPAYDSYEFIVRFLW